jgi:two-component system sensor histidine kinase PhoQ
VTSLRTRVTLVAGLVLIVFILLTSVALERAFQTSVRSAREARLLGQVYLLMASAENQDGVLELPEQLAEADFNLPGSGVYGRVSTASDQVVWQSASVLTPGIPFHAGLAPGEQRFSEATDLAGQDYLVKGYGVTWSIGPIPRDYTFSVAEDLTEYRRELAVFRASLAGWLGALALVLPIALLIALRWGLAPLRRVAAEVAAIEAGTQDRLHGRYPSELRSLTDNLNALLAHESARQTRLGNALADLAHSLKTPLAVIRGVLDEVRSAHFMKAGTATDDTRIQPPAPALPSLPWADRLAEQLIRMEEIVAYQLERARARPVATLAPPVMVAPVLERLRGSLVKLYAGRAVDLTLTPEPGLVFRGVEGDLLEILGNLLDNAYKWCRTRVVVGGRREGDWLVIWVEDDGPGIPPEQARQVIERGARADLRTPGHGIGLAVVNEICMAYGGTLSIDTSALGGSRVRVRLPV